MDLDVPSKSARVSYIVDQISFFFGMLLRPTERIFLGFLLSSLIIAIVVFVSRQSKSIPTHSRLKQALRQTLDPKIFSHKSALVDYQILALNSVPRFLLQGARTILSTAASVATSWALQAAFPRSWHLSASSWMVILAYTLILFLAHDATRFLLHYFQHRLPWLWRFHSVHHSAEVLTPFTLYRVHPFDIFLFNIRHIIVVGLVAGVFLYATEGQLTAYTVLGIEVLSFLFNIAGSNLRHSHVSLGFGALENIVLSPAQHQIHHSNLRAHFDKNFGSALALWDKAFGTWIPSEKDQQLIYGIDDTDHSTLWRALSNKPGTHKPSEESGR